MRDERGEVVRCEAEVGCGPVSVCLLTSTGLSLLVCLFLEKR